MQLILQTTMPPHTAVGRIDWDQHTGTITGDSDLAAIVRQAATLATMQGYIRPAPSLARVDIDQPLKHVDQLSAVLAFGGYYSADLSSIAKTAENQLADDLTPVVY
jgi:hypothetical protein